MSGQETLGVATRRVGERHGRGLSQPTSGDGYATNGKSV